MAVQLSQHLVEETVLPPLSNLGALIKYRLTAYARVYFWALHSLPVVSVFDFLSLPCCAGNLSSVLYHEVETWEASSSVLSSGLLWLEGVFCGSIGVEEFFSISVGK